MKNGLCGLGFVANPFSTIFQAVNAYVLTTSKAGQNLENKLGLNKLNNFTANENKKKVYYR
jgi:hypothetical protein